MDGTGTFDLDDRGAASSPTEAGVESPIGIGNDERRMHVRAYNYWVSLLDGRAYPSIEDLDPETLGDFGGNSLLLDFTAGIENPAITFLGEALRRECDLPVGIASTRDIPSRSLLSRLTDHYLQIIANRAPIGFEAEFENERGSSLMYRGILMPLSSDDDTIDFIYGVINWKEVADDALTAGIADEVERALLAHPPRASAPLPVWADGPNANEPEFQIKPRADVLGSSDETFEPVLASPAALSIYPDDAGDDLTAFEPDGSEGLSDWLAAARDLAEAASEVEGRSRTALYRALSLAYDFALAAEANADDYAELLVESGIAVQARAPMTPIVKLVFGTGYDKTRLAEYALILSHGRRINLSQGSMLSTLETTPGGLKAIVAAERAAKRPAPKPAVSNVLLDRARNVRPKGIVEMDGTDEFVVLFARRIDANHVAVISQIDHDTSLVQRALRQIKG
jgi:hypothetical protein